MSTVGWTFIVTQDCEFAGLPLAAGSTLHVYPGTVHAISNLQTFPPNYGVLLGLLADDLITVSDGPSLSLLPPPALPSLELISGSRRRASPAFRSRWARARLALVR